MSSDAGAGATTPPSLDPGLAGLVAAQTVLSYSDGARGILWVRGYTLPELVTKFGYDGAVGVLWEGFAGTALDRDETRRRLGAGRLRAFARLPGWLDRAERRPFVEGVRLALASLPEDAAAAEILATLPVAIAALLRRRAGGEPVEPDPLRGTADDLLRMAHGEAKPAAMSDALDTYFASVIDNGLNTSAFTARVVASSGASLASAALGAYCAFTGPLHGGAPGPTLDMLDEAQASGDVRRWAERKLTEGARLMGFGHRVFRLGDPRADLLYQALERLRVTLGPSIGRLAFAAEVEQAVGDAFARLKPGRPPLRPNIEINAALLLDAVGFPRDGFMPVFAVARGAGWLAHAMEQRTVGRLIRPGSAYIGPIPADAEAAPN
ncbi:MAG: citrate synthase/methylcitrate synthase [Alphaproteobacteria bacterium]|nr:citrate synthase/methylcitrate synthase [Alphaproteobacteria bacterium]